MNKRKQQFAAALQALLKEYGINLTLVLTCGEGKVASIEDTLGQVWRPTMLLTLDPQWQSPADINPETPAEAAILAQQNGGKR